MKKLGSRIICAVLAAVLCAGLGGGALAASGSAYDMGGQKLLALTFDDGPGKYSDQIMDTLEARGAKATFFVNGCMIKKYPNALKRMARDGFQIGNHTFSHVWLTKCEEKQFRSEIDANAEYITSLTGLTGTGNTGFYLRPPYGAYNKNVIASAGVPVIWCTVDSGDWKYDDSERLVNYTSSAVKDGDIVIMHETHASTANGLGRLVDKLQSMGYELVTVQELFARRGITPTAGKVYYKAANRGVNRCASELYFDESRLDSHWAYEDIRNVLDKGYMTNNQYGEFTPNFPLTRETLVTALGQEMGAPKSAKASGFTDVADDSPAAAYTAWALKKGIMAGVGEGRFDPQGTVTRQQLALILMRCRQLEGADTWTDGAIPFSDAAGVSDWAREGVAYCSKNGLMVGSGGAFDPGGEVTRAMGAVVLTQLDKQKTLKPMGFFSGLLQFFRTL